MPGDFQNLLKHLPDKPPRSKLEPYRELIRELRQKRWSYRDIAVLFEEKLTIAVAPSTLHNFVKVRARQKSAITLPPVTGITTELMTAGGKRPSVSVGDPKQKFEFTPGEALKLSPKGRQGKRCVSTRMRHRVKKIKEYCPPIWAC